MYAARPAGGRLGLTMDEMTRPVADPVTTPPRRVGLSIAVAVTAAVVVAVDQSSKTWAVDRLTGRGPLTVLDGILQFRLTRNPGAAFNLATGTTWLFTLVAIAVSVVIIRSTRRIGSRWWALAFGPLLGGAIGNLLDRLFREPGFARGHVVDFIEYLKFPFMDFPIFNVADSCIVTAAFLIVLLGLRGIGIDGRRVGEYGAAPAGNQGQVPGSDG
jgi:signal peptidase II